MLLLHMSFHIICSRTFKITGNALVSRPDTVDLSFVAVAIFPEGGGVAGGSVLAMERSGVGLNVSVQFVVVGVGLRAFGVGTDVLLRCASASSCGPGFSTVPFGSGGGWGR